MIPLADHAVYSPQSRRGEGKHINRMSKEGYAAAQNNWKWNSEFYKEEKLKDNSIYSKLVTIGFALPSTNRGNMRKESPNDF